MRSAPSSASASSASPAVAVSGTSISRMANTSPASSSATSWNTLAPSTRSPAMSARCTGAAPRHAGSREKCRLIHPAVGAESSGSRTSPPYATITPSSTCSAEISAVAASSSRAVLITGRPSSTAAWATGDGVSNPPSPERGIGSRDDRGDVVRGRETSQGGHGGSGCAGEDEAHEGSPEGSELWFEDIEADGERALGRTRPFGGGRSLSSATTAARRAVATRGPEP